MRRIVLLVALAALLPAVRAAAAAKRHYEVAGGDAATTLRQFVEQSGEQVVYLVTKVRGVKTNPVKGEFTAREVLDRMVNNTGLIVVQDAKTGALFINRQPAEPPTSAPPPPPSRQSEYTPPPAAPPAAPLPQPKSLASRIAAAVALLAAPAAPAAERRLDERPAEAVQLSPFEVTADLDHGYRAGGTLAGTRLRTDLKDIAASVSVVTRDFLKDLGANNLEQVLNYTLGTEVDGLGGNFSNASLGASFVDQESALYTPVIGTRVRGLSSADQTRDFFLSDIQLDNYNTDRIDINRGANSMLFGLGSPAGIINGSLIKAATNRNKTEVEVQFARFGTHRETIDHNQVLVRDKLALRVAGLFSERYFQLEPAFMRDKRVFGTTTFRPFKTTTLRVNTEWARQDSNRPQTRPPNDNITYWWAMGKPIYDPTTNTGTLLGTPESALLNPFNANGTPNGTLLLQGLGEIRTNVGVILEQPNVPGYGITGLPGVQGLEAINERALPGGTTLAMYSLRQSQIYRRFAAGGTANPFSTFWRDQQITDPRIFDFFNHMIDGPGKYEFAAWKTYNITLDQTFLDGVAGVELSWDRQDLKAGFSQPFGTRNYAVNIDINSKLPNGAPNPNLGRPFVSDFGWSGSDGADRESLRATGYVDVDLRRYLRQPRLARILGRHTVTLNYSEQRRKNYSFAGRATLMGLDHFAAETATIPLANSTSSGRRQFSELAYVGPSLLQAAGPQDIRTQPLTVNIQPGGLNEVTVLYNQSPPAGTTTPTPWQVRTFSIVRNDRESVVQTTAFTPIRARQKFDAGVAVLQSKWLADTLVTTAGSRRDNYETFTVTGTVIDPVTGASITDPAILVPQRGLAATENTTFYGVVAHVPSFIERRLPLGMNASLTYNRADNFRPTAQRFTFLNRAIDPESGETTEYGARAGFLGGKFELRAARYKSTAAYATNSALRDTQARFVRMPDELIEANSQGINDDKPAALASWNNWLQSPAGRQFMDTFRYVLTPQANGSTLVTHDLRQDIVVATSDVVAKGWEFEGVFNPTRTWRIALNAARQEAMRSHTAEDFRAFVAAIEPVWAGPAGSAGDLWRDSARTITVRDYFLVNQAELRKQVLLDGSRSPELRKWRFNFVHNFRFTEGALKGWNVGGSVRWQDRAAIGYPVVVTAVGPSYDVTRPYYAKAESNYDAWLGYGRRFGRVEWRAQLNVRNIGVHDKLIPVATQPDGSIGSYRIVEPMIWTLRNTFTF